MEAAATAGFQKKKRFHLEHFPWLEASSTKNREKKKRKEEGNWRKEYTGY